MKNLMIACSIVTFGIAIFLVATQKSVSQEDGSKLIGAGIFYCGGSSYLSNGDTCDRSSEGVWKCGPQLNISTPGWGNVRAKSLRCGASCTGNGSTWDSDCPE